MFFTRVLRMTLKKRFLAGLLCVPLLGLGACSADEPTTGEMQAAETPADGSTSEMPQAPVGIGESSSSGGVELTVQEVWSSPTVRLNGETQEAPDDGKFVYVKTTGKNETTGNLQLVCSSSIGTVVIDSQGSAFGEWNNLNQYKGNPDCGDATEPGSDFPEMTYIFYAPKDADIQTFGWKPKNKNSENDGQLVRVNIAPVESR